MKRTEILCPECFKKRILTKDDKEGFCDQCGTEYIITGKNSVRYK